MFITARVDKFKLVWQRNQVAAGLVEATVDTSKIPQATFVLVGLFGLVNHEASFFIKRPKMKALFLIPSAYLIAHRLHLLG